MKKRERTVLVLQGGGALGADQFQHQAVQELEGFRLAVSRLLRKLPAAL